MKVPSLRGTVTINRSPYSSFLCSLLDHFSATIASRYQKDYRMRSLWPHAMSSKTGAWHTCCVFKVTKLWRQFDDHLTYFLCWPVFPILQTRDVDKKPFCSFVLTYQADISQKLQQVRMSWSLLFELASIDSAVMVVIAFITHYRIFESFCLKIEQSFPQIANQLWPN